MIITLTGENGFVLSQTLDKLVADFVAEQGDLSLERLDGGEADYSKIREALTGLPFLASKKLVVLKSASLNKQFMENAEQLLSGLPESTTLILVEPKLDKRLGFYKLLKNETAFKEFKELDGAQLASWLVDQAKKAGGSLSTADARYLVERLGTNQLTLSNELDKLLLYDPKITRPNIDHLTEPAPQSTIFELLEAAFQGNTKQAINLYAEQRALKVEPAQIIAMLAWQLHVLAVIKAAGERDLNVIAGEAKLSPFVVKKSAVIARRLSLAQIKEIISELATIDFRSKRESIDSDEALQNYLLTLA